MLYMNHIDGAGEKMEYLEIIHVRCSNKGNKALSQFNLEKIVRDAEKEDGLKHIQLYRNASLRSDTSVHIFHKSSEHLARKSEFGLHLAVSLKEFCLVSHSLWLLEEDWQCSQTGPEDRPNSK
jgi:hypothetical protein